MNANRYTKKQPDLGVLDDLCRLILLQYYLFGTFLFNLLFRHTATTRSALGLAGSQIKLSIALLQATLQRNHLYLV